MERPRESTVVAPLSRGAINPHPVLMALLMVTIVVAAVAGVVVAMSLGHAAFVLSIVLIAFGLIAAATVC
ncbi:hypothetical protein ACXDF8_14455 [Mycolicibacterium sp. CBM1]